MGAAQRRIAGGSPGWRSDPWALFAALVVLSAYIGIAWFMPKHVFWSPDEGGRLLQIRSIHWDGGVHFALPYQGQRRDPSLRFYPRGRPDHPFLTYPQPGTDGSVRFHWPLGFSMLVWPLERTLGYPGLYVVPLLSGWLIALLCGQVAGSFDRQLRLPAILLTGFATPVWFYSLTLWDHTLASLFALMAALILIERPLTLRRTVVGALALFLAMALRFELIAFALAVALTWLITWFLQRRSGRAQELSARSLLRALLAGFLLVTLGGIVWLSSLSPRHRDMLSSLPLISAVQRRLPNLFSGARHLLVNSVTSEGPRTPPAADNAVLIALMTAVVCPWIRSVWGAVLFLAAAGGVLGYSIWLLWLPQYYRALHGMIPIAPFVMFAAASLPAWWRARTRSLTVLVVLTLGYVALGLGVNFAAYSDPRNGELWNTLEWGPRYVLTAYPLLVILSLLGIRALLLQPRAAAIRWLAAALAAGMVWVAVQHQIRGLNMLHSSRQIFASWDAALPRDLPVITDIWWLPTTLAGYYVNHEVYYVADRRGLEEWVTQFSGGKATELEMASRTAVETSDFGIHASRLSVRETRSVNGLVLTRLQIGAPR